MRRKGIVLFKHWGVHMRVQHLCLKCISMYFKLSGKRPNMQMSTAAFESCPGLDRAAEHERMWKLEILAEESNKHIFPLQPVPVDPGNKGLLDCKNTVSSTQGWAIASHRQAWLKDLIWGCQQIFKHTNQMWVCPCHPKNLPWNILDNTEDSRQTPGIVHVYVHQYDVLELSQRDHVEQIQFLLFQKDGQHILKLFCQDLFWLWGRFYTYKKTGRMEPDQGCLEGGTGFVPKEEISFDFSAGGRGWNLNTCMHIQWPVEAGSHGSISWTNQHVCSWFRCFLITDTFATSISNYHLLMTVRHIYFVCVSVICWILFYLLCTDSLKLNSHSKCTVSFTDLIQ